MRSSRARALAVAAVCAAGSAIAAGIAYGAAGDLDRSFGGDGLVTVNTISGNAEGVATDSRNRVVAVGDCPDPACVVRYTPRGRLDRSFSRDGKVLNNEFSARAVAQGSGRIVVAGDTLQGHGRNAFVVARFLSDGHLDRSFGHGGMVTTDMGGRFQDVHAVAIDSRGRVVVGGYAYGRQLGSVFAVARYLPDGRLDRSFGGDGKATPSFPGFGSAGSMALDGENRIVAAGAGTGATRNMFEAIRLRVSGKLDRSFGTNGHATARFPGGAIARAVTIDRRERIVVGGSSFASSALHFALARFRQNGRLDTTFGAEGKVVTDFGDRAAYLYALAVGPRGRIVAAGRFNGRFALARYEPDGDLDHSFSDDGLVAKPGGFPDALDIDPEGRPVAAGFHDGKFAVARYKGH